MVISVDYAIWDNFQERVYHCRKRNANRQKDRLKNDTTLTSVLLTVQSPKDDSDCNCIRKNGGHFEHDIETFCLNRLEQNVLYSRTFWYFYSMFNFCVMLWNIFMKLHEIIWNRYGYVPVKLNLFCES